MLLIGSNCIIFLIFVFILIINKIVFWKKNKIFIGIKVKIMMLLLLLTLSIGFNIIFIEPYIHSQDQYKILENKFAMKYLLLSRLPLNNYFEVDNISIKLPYGFKTVNSNSAVSFGIFIPEYSWYKLKKRMPKDFEFIDQFSSTFVWHNQENNKTLFITIIRGGVDYIIINIR